MKHLITSCLVLAAGLAPGACDESQSAGIAARRVDGPAGGPATPGPRQFSTPEPRASLAFATPAPATPFPSASFPSASPTPAGLPLAAGAASAASNASGAAVAGSDPYKKTGASTDLAVSGPGYFVLATKPNPATAADLLLTRNGHFAFVHDTAGSLSLWRLVHATFNFYVVGFMVPGGTLAGAPAETSGRDHAELATVWAGQPNVALGLFIDAERNPDAPAKVLFDFSGRLKVGETAPRGADGGPVQAYVAIAQVASPQKLVPQPGFAGVYKYDPAAGALGLGVAASGEGRAVGNQNLVLTATLAQDGAPAAKP